MKLPPQVGLPCVHPYLNNKYTAWYYSIIHYASLRHTRQDNTHYQVHHIIPECMHAASQRSKTPGKWPGNPEDSHNLVTLTIREHIICHWLLTKMVTGRDYYKMEAALHRFKSTSMKLNYPPRTTEIARIIEANHRARSGAKSWIKDGQMIYQHTSPGPGWVNTNHLKGKKRWVKDTVEVYAYTCPGDGWINSSNRKGTKHWIKDGVEISSPECPGEGWIQGSYQCGQKMWFKDGVYKRARVSPGPGWTEQGNQKGKKRWCKDGQFKMSFECPGEGWLPDSSKKGKSTWIKDGRMKFSFECPGEDWVKGHLKTGIKQQPKYPKGV